MPQGPLRRVREVHRLRGQGGAGTNGSDDYDKLAAAAGKCRIKYAATWLKLRAKADGTSSSCDAPRFVDNGSTVTDNLTGLRWEKKTDDGSIHDLDDTYDWTADNNGQQPNGNVYTTFLASLNGSCFAGRCDWRLPSREELQTLLAGGYPCATNPCIDPLFGPTIPYFYWTSASIPMEVPLFAWNVNFGTGYIYFSYKDNPGRVRAVSGGL